MTWALLLLVVALLGASAFFVAAEFALVAARRTLIEPLAPHAARARATLAAMEDVSVMMACAQLGITSCGVLLGAIGEPAVAHLLGPALAAAGLSRTATDAVALAVALVLVVAAHVTFGELVPKNIALADPERTAVVLAPPLRALARALGPVVRGLNHVANLVARLFGARAAAEVASAFNRQGVADLVAQSARAGLLDADDERLIGSALDFDTATVADLVVADRDLVTVPSDATAADVERACARSGFSRFPVTGAGPAARRGARVVGFVHVRDALRVPAADRGRPLPRTAIRTLPVLAPTASLRAAVDTMRAARVHMARVAGTAGAAGVVMLEDVVERLVGEVADATRHAPGGSLG